jgi:ABC-2 type transport system permease protein
MRRVIAIYRREMGGYFVSPIAYFVIGIFLLVSGFFFYAIMSQVVLQGRSSQMGPSGMDMPGMIFRGFASNTGIVILFLVPFLTMGVYAEERKRGTMELLMTSPVSELQIVLAKYFAALTLFVGMIAPTLLFHFYMSFFSDPAPPWRIMWTGYLGIFLLGAGLVALGCFISSLTESQIIAGVATFALFILLWVLDFAVRDATTTSGEVLRYLSLLQHFDDFARGVIDTAHVVFYVSLAALGIFLTLRSLDSMRWRRA